MQVGFAPKKKLNPTHPKTKTDKKRSYDRRKTNPARREEKNHGAPDHNECVCVYASVRSSVCVCLYVCPSNCRLLSWGFFFFASSRDWFRFPFHSFHRFSITRPFLQIYATHNTKKWAYNAMLPADWCVWHYHLLCWSSTRRWQEDHDDDDDAAAIVCLCANLLFCKKEWWKKLQHNFHGQSNLKNYVALPAWLCVWCWRQSSDTIIAMRNIFQGAPLWEAKKRVWFCLPSCCSIVCKGCAGTDFYV